MGINKNAKVNDKVLVVLSYSGFFCEGIITKINSRYVYVSYENEGVQKNKVFLVSNGLETSGYGFCKDKIIPYDEQYMKEHNEHLESINKYKEYNDLYYKIQNIDFKKLSLEQMKKIIDIAENNA